MSEIDDTRVVETASDAAQNVIFSRYERSEINDIDITIHFEDDVLEVDIYLDADHGDPDQVANDAALAARSAVDRLLE
ncbi:DUF3194 domain-containing protein [Salinarchaeum sp. IM2453]|uniref:DUF3194 domain-containing protein n=1 Tax=Salinarchaeum sp. IM2453 TaxID=2862870 RepID=UPI001C83F371|nr:DUF3194 domain-containing protein [Salinarchaeum sp. IM2453]QZA89176.1 DUF3194 domain-containing protein [Salinarchaeum sp. IM2453]